MENSFSFFEKQHKLGGPGMGNVTRGGEEGVKGAMDHPEKVRHLADD